MASLTEENESMEIAMNSLSERGRQATKPMTSYFSDYLKAISDKFDPVENPNGYIPLCVAENKLCEEELQGLFNISNTSGKAFRVDSSMVKDIWYYNNMKGMDEFRQKTLLLFKDALAISDVGISENDICCLNGTGTIVENLAWNLCNDADGVLIPAPYYPAFDNDLTVRSNLTLIPCPMLKPNSTKYIFTDGPLESAYERCMARGAFPKILLITNPHNPTGVVMSKDDVLLAIKFAFFHGMHLISDEIYAKSVYDNNTTEQVKFISALTVINDLDDNDDMKRWAETNLHVIWGFSKDFCVSGFRIGVLHTKNRALHCALDNLSYFGSISQVTQLYFLNTIYSKSKEEIAAFTKTSNSRLSASANALYEILDNNNIPYIKAWSAIFVFIDLSSLLEENTYDGEKKLQNKLFNELKILFTPGKDCHAPCPGWFRVCMASVPKKSLVEAFQRIIKTFF
jgi:aspartate/methionine/tyrosine aminotransferase